MKVYKNVKFICKTGYGIVELFDCRTFLRLMKDGGCFEKMISTYASGNWQLEYKLGEKTVPKIGKIWVSNRIDDARDSNLLLEGKSPMAGLSLIKDGKIPGIRIEGWHGFWDVDAKQGNNEYLTSPNEHQLWSDCFTPEKILFRLTSGYDNLLEEIKDAGLKIVRKNYVDVTDMARFVERKETQND